ncbi:MAG: HIT family protein [Acidimicrobiaceae bacterium]|nr:HIT family protein [Acidimicrobiaceae bacterium]
MTATLFTRIIQGEIPGTFVYRDELCVAFLTINPITTGHTLVVPIEEVDQWTDLSDSTSRHLFEVANTISNAQKRVFFCERVALVIAGYEIPHCHLHLIPSNSMADLKFENALAHVERKDLEQAASLIIGELRATNVDGAV